MQIDTATDLFFVAAVFVPGFIYDAVLSTFVPRRESRIRELVLLRLFTGTALNYAICSPIIYLLVTRALFATSDLLAGLTWLVILFVAPILLGLFGATSAQRGWVRSLTAKLNLRQIHPIPTGWDWKFSRVDPCYVLVTLRDGTRIAGYFGDESMASSDPTYRDLYLERAYTIPQAGPWQPVPESSGVYIEGSQIAFIEFRT
jgi:hypothetical protein